MLTVREINLTKTAPAPLPPLTQPMHHILLTLLDGDRHGYAIMQAIEQMTSGDVRMGPGTLYGAIKRLLLAKLIVETDQRPDQELDDERRRYYRITRQGRQAVADETARLQRLVTFARSRRGVA